MLGVRVSSHALIHRDFCVFGSEQDFRTINMLVPASQIQDTVELFYQKNQRRISLRFLVRACRRAVVSCMLLDLTWFHCRVIGRILAEARYSK